MPISWKMLICVVLFGALVLPSASQAGEVGVITAQLASGPQTWMWTVGAGPGDPDPADITSYIIIDMVGSDPWTNDILGVVAMVPSGHWELDRTSTSVIRFNTKVAAASYGTFAVTLSSPGADTPSSNHPGYTGPSSAVPEASTMALLGLGLFAGALLKRRKKEE